MSADCGSRALGMGPGGSLVCINGSTGRYTLGTN